MKIYDYWLADKYLEHVADEYTLNLLRNKYQLDTITDELDLHVTNRYLLMRDFTDRARQFKEYPGMREHMKMLASYIENNQEDQAVRAIELKAKDMRKIYAQKTQKKWR